MGGAVENPTQAAYVGLSFKSPFKGIKPANGYTVVSAVSVAEPAKTEHHLVFDLVNTAGRPNRVDVSEVCAAIKDEIALGHTNLNVCVPSSIGGAKGVELSESVAALAAEGSGAHITLDSVGPSVYARLSRPVERDSGLTID